MNRDQQYTRVVARLVVGAMLAAILTIAVYLLVLSNSLNPVSIATLALVLAVVQLVVHLIFFLDLGKEAKPRWNLISFMVVGVTAMIVVIGSIWIMMNLNYNMGMTPDQIDHRMLEEGQKGF